MFRYGVIGSGSKANSYIFSYNDFAVVIDNGYSLRQFSLRAEALGFDVQKIKFIFLTHYHSDHFKGVERLSKKYNIPVVVHERLTGEKFLQGCENLLHIMEDKEYSVEDFTFFPFRTFHDAAFSLGYHFTLGGHTVTIITDTGKTSEAMEELAFKSDILFVEANYCDDALANGPYPYFLKQRISSVKGHLSNKAAIEFVNKVTSTAGCKVKKVHFCHMSENNNSDEILQSHIDDYLDWEGEYVICSHNESYRP